MAEKTLTDVLAKKNKDLPFEERAKKYLERIKPISEELGVVAWAELQMGQNALQALPNLMDAWASGKD